MVEGSRGPDSQAIYYDVSPKWLLICKIFGIVAAVAVLVTVICAGVRLQDEKAEVILSGINCILSGLLALYMAWCYKKSAIAADKLWYVHLLTWIVVIQCITSIVFMFTSHDNSPAPTTVSTPTTAIVSWSTVNTNVTTFPPNLQPGHV